MITLSNPRLQAEFNDWPSGGDRVKCIFSVESVPGKGQRISRTTADKSGKMCKPKVSTYGNRACIVDGDDGKTYLLFEASQYRAVTVSRFDFKNSDLGTVFADSNPELYNTLISLLDQAHLAAKIEDGWLDSHGGN